MTVSLFLIRECKLSKNHSKRATKKKKKKGNPTTPKDLISLENSEVISDDGFDSFWGKIVTFIWGDLVTVWSELNNLHCFEESFNS